MRESKHGQDHALPAPFPAVALVGPTAVGKTALSIRLARQINAEIVNVDSIQVYRGLDIGSAKPVPEERSSVPHHLLDIVEPDEPFDAADFLRMAQRVLLDIRSRGKTVLLTGGTGLYLKALTEGLAECPGQDPVLRTVLKRVAASMGRRYLHDLLRKVDPESADRIHKNDLFRVIRALEVFYATGRPLSAWHRLHRLKRGRLVVSCRKIGLMRPREELYKRIGQRVERMMEQGFLEEVKGLLEKGFHRDLKPLQSLGYRHIIAYLYGELTLSDAMEQLKRDTRRYAKRQITWFRSDPSIRWFNPEKLIKEKDIWKAIEYS